MREDSYLISGSNDAELKVWNVRDRSDIDTEDKDKLSEQLNQLLLSEDEPDLTVSNIEVQIINELKNLSTGEKKMAPSF